MRDDEPMPLEVLVGLVQLVKKGNGWPTKGGLVLAIGAQRLGGWFTAEDAAEHIGRAAGTCRRLLRQLEDERVILRDAGVGGEAGAGGGVLYWVEANPRWEDWRVSWRMPRRLVRQRVVLMREQAEKAALERFFARSYDARYPRISARLWTREKVEREAVEAAFSRVPWARESVFPEGPLRAKTGGKRRSGAPDSRAHGRANFAATSGERGSTSSGDVDEVLSPVAGPASPKRERGVSISRSHRLAAVRAVCARTLPGKDRPRPAVWGSSADRLDQLVADHGLEDVLAACEKIDAGVYQVPSFLAALEDLLAHGVLPDVEDQTVATGLAARPSRAILEDKRRQLAQRVATYEAEGYEPPEELVADLRRVEAELANYPDQVSDQRAEGATT